jgi:hypothetical protein
MALVGTTDGYVQVAPDSTGKKIDNAELTRDGGVVVERQRIVVASDENPRVQAQVDGEPGRGYLVVDSQRFDEIIEKLDEIATILRLGFD